MAQKGGGGGEGGAEPEAVKSFCFLFCFGESCQQVRECPPGSVKEKKSDNRE